jgi:hypothetical protein
VPILVSAEGPKGLRQEFRARAAGHRPSHHDCWEGERSSRAATGAHRGRSHRARGGISFGAFRQIGDDRTYVLLERYVSRQAFADHRDTKHFKDIVLGQIVLLLDSRTVECFDVDDTSV